LLKKVGRDRRARRLERGREEDFNCEGREGTRREEEIWVEEDEEEGRGSVEEIEDCGLKRKRRFFNRQGAEGAKEEKEWFFVEEGRARPPGAPS
jgi:hypothetical protein